MIIWINGAFGAGKTTTASKLQNLLPGSFIYDPEEAGFFIRGNAPKSFSEGDFQDIPLWREINYLMLKTLAQSPTTIIVPMTLINPNYYNEIIGKLLADGIDIRHFILYIDKPTLIKRLMQRSFGFIDKEKFAIDAIDRCMYAFENHITEIKIPADTKSAKDIALEIKELIQ